MRNFEICWSLKFLNVLQSGSMKSLHWKVFIGKRLSSINFIEDSSMEELALFPKVLNKRKWK